MTLQSGAEKVKLLLILFIIQSSLRGTKVPAALGNWPDLLVTKLMNFT
jgi:hypothetical protein